jgi:hypothetical protein
VIGALRSTTIKGKKQTVRRDAANRRGSSPPADLARLWAAPSAPRAVASDVLRENQRRWRTRRATVPLEPSPFDAPRREGSDVKRTVLEGRMAGATRSGSWNARLQRARTPARSSFREGGPCRPAVQYVSPGQAPRPTGRCDALTADLSSTPNSHQSDP